MCIANADSLHFTCRGKVVSLNSLFRFSGLNPNTVLLLEPVKQRVRGRGRGRKKREKKVKVIEICVQTKDGKRHIGEFSVRSTLWEVLQKMEEQSTYPFLSSVDPKTGTYLMPSVNLLQRKISGLETLTTMTLHKLGLSQSALFRFEHVACDDTLEKVQAYVAQKPVAMVDEDEDEDEEDGGDDDDSQQEAPSKKEEAVVLMADVDDDADADENANDSKVEDDLLPEPASKFRIDVSQLMGQFGPFLYFSFSSSSSFSFYTFSF